MSVLVAAPKNDDAELENRVEGIFHDVISFMEADKKGGGLPTLASLAKPLKPGDVKLKVAAKGYKANRNKRKMLFTLSGPALAYAGVGLVGLAAGASNPFGWVVLGTAATGWVLGKATKKGWRNLRAAVFAEPEMKKLMEAANNADVKVTRYTVNQARFWLQKKKLSSVSDLSKQVFEAWDSFQETRKKPIKSCYDICEAAADLYRMQTLGPELAKDYTEFQVFNKWVANTVKQLADKYTKENIYKCLRKILYQVTGSGTHAGCKECCYNDENDEPFPKKPMHKASTISEALGRAPAGYQASFGRVLLDAYNRVHSGWLSSKMNYLYDLHTEIVEFAAAVGAYDPKITGGKRSIMSYTAYPDQPLKGDAGAAALQKLIETGKVELNAGDLTGAKGAGAGAAAGLSGGKAMAIGSITVPIKAEIAKALGQETMKALGENAYAASVSLAQSFAAAGGAAGGGAADALFQKMVNWANARYERTQLKKEMAKKVKDRDISAVLTSLRTLLKDEGQFETFGTQFGKVAEHFNTYLELLAKKQLANCTEAYELAVAVFEVWKHMLKAAASLDQLECFTDIVDDMIDATDEDILELMADDLVEDATAWLRKHPREQCKSVCYHPEDADFIEMVDDKGNVVGVEPA